MDDRAAVIETISRYLSAVDRRDGDLAGSLFETHAITEIFVRTSSSPARVTELMEHELVQYAVDKWLPIHPPGEICRHMTSDHIVDLKDGTASVQAQFIVLRADAAPGTSQAAGGPFGLVMVKQSGSIQTELRKTAGAWKISHHRVFSDLRWPEMPLA